MPDKTYAKVVLNGTTYVDLTSDTVDPSTLLSGYTAHNRSGELITGSFDTSIFVLKAGDTMTGPLILSASSPVTTGVEYISTLDKNILTLSAKSLASGLTMSEIVTTVEPGSIKVYDDIVQSNYNYTEITSNEVCIYVSDDGEDEVISKIGANELTINRHDLLRMTPHFAQMFAMQITANKNLHTTEFLKVGQYYCDSSSTVASLTNCPVTTAFTMTVEAPIQTTYDDENLTTASYRLRTIKTCNGEVFIQYVARSNGGTYTYYSWQPGSIGVLKDTYTNTNMKEGNLIARRNGNVVSILSTGNAVSVASGNWRTYVTIGAVYRPTEEVYANVTNAYGEVKTVRVRTNGNVDLYTGTTISAASNFAFNITYIVD